MAIADLRRCIKRVATGATCPSPYLTTNSGVFFDTSKKKSQKIPKPRTRGGISPPVFGQMSQIMSHFTVAVKGMNLFPQVIVRRGRIAKGSRDFWRKLSLARPVQRHRFPIRSVFRQKMRRRLAIANRSE
jgi:hypothetical protein